jgi:hypothetical protein
MKFSAPSRLSGCQFARSIRRAPPGRRLAVARALAPFLIARSPKSAAPELCEFHSVDDYPLCYARLALLLDRPEEIPAPGEIEFLYRLQNRGIHYPGAIGGPDYLFLMAFASILAPVRALEIGTSSGFSSAVIAAALQQRHPGRTRDAR